MADTDDLVRREARVLTAYMSQAEAIGFATNWVLDPSSFMQSWQATTTALASMPTGFPTPRIEPMPPSTIGHTTQLCSHPLFTLNYGGNAQLRMVELGKLIAMQHWVDCDASGGVHGGGLSTTPQLDELLTMCLPLDLAPSAQTHWQQVPNGLVISTLDNSFGIKSLEADPTNNVMKIVLGSNANLILVREHAGRYVLANGYHRAWLLRSRNVEMVPAVVVSMPDQDQVVPPGFINKSHIFGDRPPRVDDFTDDALAASTQTRAMVTTVRVSLERLRVPRVI